MLIVVSFECKVHALLLAMAQKGVFIMSDFWLKFIINHLKGLLVFKAIECHKINIILTSNISIERLASTSEKLTVYS